MVNKTVRGHRCAAAGDNGRTIPPGSRRSTPSRGGKFRIDTIRNISRVRNPLSRRRNVTRKRKSPLNGERVKCVSKGTARFTRVRSSSSSCGKNAVCTQYVLYALCHIVADGFDILFGNHFRLRFGHNNNYCRSRPVVCDYVDRA